jgi:hypothetical protein
MWSQFSHGFGGQVLSKMQSCENSKLNYDWLQVDDISQIF